MHNINKSQRAEIGYWISEKVEKLGIVIKSVEILENYSITDLKLRELIIKVQPENKKSIKVAQRLEYKKESYEKNKEGIVFDIYRKEVQRSVKL